MAGFGLLRRDFDKNWGASSWISLRSKAAILLRWLLGMCGGLLVLPSTFCRAAESRIPDLLTNPEKSKRRTVTWEFLRREFIRNFKHREKTSDL